MPRRLTLAPIPLALLVVALVGCTASTRIPPPQPPAASEPLFASDEEALAAATAAYEQYLAISNAVFREPPRDVTQLAGVVTEQFLENERPLAAQFDENGWTIQGGSNLTGTRLQQWFSDNEGAAVVVFYVCLDVSGARILDASGADVTPDGRPDEVTLEVSMTGNSSIELLVDRSELWQESNSCV